VLKATLYKFPATVSVLLLPIVTALEEPAHLLLSGSSHTLNRAQVEI